MVYWSSRSSKVIRSNRKSVDSAREDSWEDTKIIIWNKRVFTRPYCRAYA